MRGQGQGILTRFILTASPMKLIRAPLIFHVCLQNWTPDRRTDVHPRFTQR